MTSQKEGDEIELDRLNPSGSRAGHPPVPVVKFNLWTLLWSPFSTIHRIFTFITTFIPYLARFSLKATPARRQLPPQDTASRFIREFEELYGPDHIAFENRGYSDVTAYVKQNDLYLLVILLSDEHDDTPAFCRDVLCNDQLKEWLHSNDCVVWGGNVADSEAHTVSTSLTCTRFPCMGLIANIPSPTSSSPIQMALLSRIEGLVTPAQLIATLTTAVNRTRPTVTRQRALKEEQRSARELRRMQEEAYSNSLAQDRAREAEQRRREEEEAQKQREREEQARKAELRQKQREQWRLWKSIDLKKAGLVGMKSEIGKTARVGLRLAGGERTVQMFPGDIALAEVYSFVECYDLLFPQSASEVTLRTANDSNEVEVEKPEDYEHYFKFRLVVPYPRKVIDSGLTLVKEESALWPSGSIVVEEIEDDTEDEDSDEEEM